MYFVIKIVTMQKVRKNSLLVYAKYLFFLFDKVKYKFIYTRENS